MILDQLAKRHNEWIRMACSLGCDLDQAQDVVQDMYIRMHKFVKDPSKITDDRGRINSLYVFVTIRNLINNEHNRRSRFANHESEELDLIIEQSTFQLDHTSSELDEEEFQLERCIECEVESWHHYDRKLWILYWSDEKMTMRKLHEETHISLSSIYTTLKNGKEKIQSKCNFQFENWKEAFGKNEDFA